MRTEFSSEIELLAKIDHRNLVKLLGYIDKGNERLLITEFVPNGTLREHLDGKTALLSANNLFLNIESNAECHFDIIGRYAWKNPRLQSAP